MRSSRVLVILLFLAGLSADLLAMAIVNGQRIPHLQWPDLRLAIPLSLAFSQVSLAVIWAALGGTPLPWRLAAAVTTIALWSVALSQSLPGILTGYGKNQWTVLMLFQGLVLGAGMIGLRRVGFRIGGTEDRVTAVCGQFQFSLGYLLAWLTAAAVILGMLRHAIDGAPIPASDADWVAVGLCNAAIGFASVRAVLGRRARGIPATMAHAAVLGLIPVCVVMASLLWANRVAIITLAVLEAFWLLTALAIIRAAGFRTFPGATLPADTRLGAVA